MRLMSESAGEAETAYVENWKHLLVFTDGKLSSCSAYARAQTPCAAADHAELCAMPLCQFEALLMNAHSQA